jgi:hypothetical protein
VDDLDELLGGSCTRITPGCGRVHDVIADVVFNYFRNEPVEGPPTRGDLLQNRCALRLHFNGAFNRFQLAADASDPGQQLLLFRLGM